MPSETLDHALTNTTDESVFTTRGWTQIWAHLESTAGGTNTLAMGSRHIKVEGGTTVGPMVLAPNTEIKIKTTSASPVQWSIMLTDLRFIDILEQYLCGGAR